MMENTLKVQQISIFQRKAKQIQIISLKSVICFLILALLICLSCKEEYVKDEIFNIFELINKETKDSNNLPISESFGFFPNEQLLKNYREIWIEEEGSLLSKEDIIYIKEQQEDIVSKKSNWGDYNIQNDIIDISKVSESEKPMTKEWWVSFVKKYDQKNIRFYSFPLFNKSHTLAFLTYKEYSQITGNGTSSENFILKKGDNNQWGLLSRENIDY